MSEIFINPTCMLSNILYICALNGLLVMAGAVIAALPTALIYILLGRFFIRGILAGSVKG